MVKTKEIEIEWETSDGKPTKAMVTMKKLTFGEMNDVKEMSTQIKAIGNTPQVTVSQKTLSEQCLLKSIIKAPFTIDITGIRNLDKDVGDKLWEEFTVFNGQSP